MTENNKQFWAIMPAAGVGKRMAADRPKQYLSLQKKTVIEHSLNRLLNHAALTGAVVALDKNDGYWSDLDYQHDKPVIQIAGGAERFESVLNALLGLASHLSAQDISHVWVLVHDAARPCVRETDLSLLIEQASHDDHGGLLALPVRDTMKRALPDSQKTEEHSLNSYRVDLTVDRANLWHALTPQMFKLPLLINALQMAAEKSQHVTDDASAMELAGYSPKLVQGHEDNIKITRPFDLELANLYFQQQQFSQIN